MKLYIDFSSEPARAVYLFLKCNNVDFETHVVDITKGENKTAEYTKINPFQLVPAMDDDGFILTESVAIMRYVATKYKLADHWFQTQDVKKQARVDEFLNWYHTNLRKHCLALELTKLLGRISLPGHPKVPYTEEKLKELKNSVAKTINDMDDYFLVDKPFIGGEEMSAADLLAYNELLNQQIFKEEIYKSNVNINAWMERCASKVKPFAAKPMAVLEEWKTTYANAKE